MAQKIKELTIEEAAKHPGNFMYVFATDEFLSYIPKKYASIIRVKKANETKVLRLSALKYLGSDDKWTQYRDAIKQAFVNIYKVTPIDGLVTLAQGGELAGKNWSEGVYGVGATAKTTEFSATSNGQKVTVDPETGHIFRGTEDITDTSKTVYQTIKKETIAYQYFTDTALIFMSQYDKKTKKYYAASFSDADGVKYNAQGQTISEADAATVWGNIQLSTDWLQNVINWILSLFGGGTQNVETLNTDNTLPNQQTDGFVYESGFGTAGVLLALAAGGAVLAKMKKSKKIIV